MSALAKGSVEPGRGYLLADRFELVRLLHANESSAVFLASDHRDREALRSLKVLVALKVFDRSGAHVTDQRERIRADYERASRFIHKNLVRMFECIDGPDFQAISMEYVDGPDLSTLMRERRLAPDAVLDLIHQLAGVLAMLHVNGVSHGALSGGKILLCSDGSVKLNLLSSKGVLPSNSALLGGALTAGKLTPAQSDIAALGALGFEMVHGRPPHGTGSVLSQFVRSLEHFGARISPRLYRLPDPRFERVLQRAITDDPLLRYHDAGELQRELAEIIGYRRADAAVPYRPDFAVLRRRKFDPAGYLRARVERITVPVMEWGRRVLARLSAPRRNEVVPVASSPAAEVKPLSVPLLGAPVMPGSSQGSPSVVTVSAAWLFLAAAALYLMVVLLILIQLTPLMRTLL